MKNRNSNKKTLEELAFTGERMIPDINRGQTFYYEHLIRYLMATQFAKDNTILDIGCGVGYGCWILKKFGAKSVKGIDYSKETINYAKKKYRMKDISFEVGDAENLLINTEKFDLLVAYELIEHLKNQKKFLGGVKANLKEKGIFIVSTPNKNTYQGKNPFHINELTPNEFESLLKPFFKYVYLFDQRFLFSNLIIPVHSNSDLKLNTLNESYIVDKVTGFIPVNKIENSRYLIAFCSDQELKNINNFSISALDIDTFSLKDGIEGMYASWNSSKEENKELRRQLNAIIDARFYKVWQSYCKIRDYLFRR